MSKYIKLSLSALSILLSGTSQATTVNKESKLAFSPLTEDEKREVKKYADVIFSELSLKNNKVNLEARVQELKKKAHISESMAQAIKIQIFLEKDAQDPASSIFKFMPENFKKAILAKQSTSSQSISNVPKKLTYDEQKAEELSKELERRANSSSKSINQTLNEMMLELPKDNSQATSQSFVINGQTKSFTDKQINLVRERLNSSAMTTTSQKSMLIEEKKESHLKKLVTPNKPKLSEDDKKTADFVIQDVLEDYKRTPFKSNLAILQDFIDNQGIVLSELQKSYIRQQLGKSLSTSSTTKQLKEEQKEEKIVRKATSTNTELTTDFIRDNIKSVLTPGGGNCGDLAVGMTRPVLLEGFQKIMAAGIPKGYNISKTALEDGEKFLANKNSNYESLDSKVLRLAAFGNGVHLRFILRPTELDKAIGLTDSEEEFDNFNVLSKLDPKLPVLFIDKTEGGGHYQATSYSENMTETQEKDWQIYVQKLPQLARNQNDEMLKDAPRFYKSCDKTIENYSPFNK